MNAVAGAKKVQTEMDVAALGLIHKHFLRGFEQAIATEYETRKAVELIEKIERILIGSGHMTEFEIRVRHKSAAWITEQKGGKHNEEVGS